LDVKMLYLSILMIAFSAWRYRSADESSWDYTLEQVGTAFELEDLFFHLQRYTQRRLTYESDAIFAIAGLIGRYCPEIDNRPNKMVHRLPSAAFDYAVYLKPSGITLKRRPEIMSRSWVGWEGLLSFNLGEERHHAGV